MGKFHFGDILRGLTFIQISSKSTRIIVQKKNWGEKVKKKWKPTQNQTKLFKCGWERWQFTYAHLQFNNFVYITD